MKHLTDLVLKNKLKRCALTSIEILNSFISAVVKKNPPVWKMLVDATWEHDPFQGDPPWTRLIA